MKRLFLISIVFCCDPLLACKLGPTSDWFLPLSSIYSKTDQIFVGKVKNIQDLCTTDGPVVRDSGESTEQFGNNLRKGCYSYSFNVLKKIKGTFKEGDIVQVRGRLKGRDKEKIFHGADCQISIGFNPAETYLIFMNAFHPDAYRKIESVDSPWVKEIMSLNKGPAMNQVDLTTIKKLCASHAYNLEIKVYRNSENRVGALSVTPNMPETTTTYFDIDGKELASEGPPLPNDKTDRKVIEANKAIKKIHREFSRIDVIKCDK